VIEESLGLAREVKNVLVQCAALANLALVAVLTGDEVGAASLAADSLRLSCEVGDKRTTVECLHALAGVAAVRGEPLRTAMLSGAAEALHAAIKAPPSPAEDALSERFIPTARAATDERSFTVAWSQGGGMTVDEAIAYALSDMPETSSRPETPSPKRRSL